MVSPHASGSDEAADDILCFPTSGVLENNNEQYQEYFRPLVNFDGFGDDQGVEF